MQSSDSDDSEKTDNKEPEKTDNNKPRKTSKIPKWIDAPENNEKSADPEGTSNADPGSDQGQSSIEAKNNDEVGTSRGCCSPCTFDEPPKLNNKRSNRSSRVSLSDDTCSPCSTSRIQTTCESSQRSLRRSYQPVRRSKTPLTACPGNRKSSKNNAKNVNADGQNGSVAKNDRSASSATANNASDGEEGSASSGNAPQTANTETSQDAPDEGGEDQDNGNDACPPCSDRPSRGATGGCPGPVGRSASCPPGCGVARPAPPRCFTPRHSWSYSFHSLRGSRPSSRCRF